MDDDDAIEKGPFKGKKVTFAETEGIEAFYEISTEFMEAIFELLPGEYLITDESDISDFTEAGSADSSDIWNRISEVYGIERAEVESERFISIFAEIARRRNLH
jgi:hypothetical protein